MVQRASLTWPFYLIWRASKIWSSLILKFLTESPQSVIGTKVKFPFRRYALWSSHIRPANCQFCQQNRRPGVDDRPFSQFTKRGSQIRGTHFGRSEERRVGKECRSR